MRTLLSSAVLLSCALLLGLHAAAIWMVSAAHGHGLASGDRTAIVVLTVASTVSLLAGIFVLSRR